MKGGDEVLSKRRESFKNKDIFFEAEYEAVFRYILSLCRNEAEAQDITQDTFLKEYRQGKTFRVKFLYIHGYVRLQKISGLTD